MYSFRHTCSVNRTLFPCLFSFGPLKSRLQGIILTGPRCHAASTGSHRPEDYISLEHATNNKVSETSHVSHQLLWHPSLASTDQVSLTVVYLAGNHSQSRTGWKGCWPIQITGRTFQVRASIACREVFTNHRQTGKHSPNRTTQRLRKVVPRSKTEISKRTRSSPS